MLHQVLYLSIIYGSNRRLTLRVQPDIPEEIDSLYWRERRTL